MRRDYPGLDLIRLAAALLVAVYHFAYWLVPAGQRIDFWEFGWVGVEIFFVLSGFVIAMSAEGRALAAFVKSRALRLYPAAFLCTTMTAVYAPMSLATYARSITLFPHGPWATIAYWTLPVEIAFYGLVALAIWRRWNLARVALALGFYSSAYWLLYLADPWLGLDLSWVDSSFGYLTLLQLGIFFATGMLLYARAYPAALLLFLAVGMGECAWRAVQAQQAPIAASCAFALAAAMIFAAIRWNDALAPRLRRLPTRTLGLMTYPLYLLHPALALKTDGVLVPLALSLLLAFLVLPLEQFIRAALGARAEPVASLP